MLKQIKRFGIISGLSMLSTPLWAADAYDVIDLGKLTGKESYGMSINEAGMAAVNAAGVLDEVTGLYDFQSHAALSDNGNLTEIGFLDDGGQGNSWIFALNDSNIGAGYSLKQVDVDGTTYNFETAVIYDGVGGLTEIPQLVAGETTHMRALSLNNNNWVVGFAFYDDPDDLDTNGDPILVQFERGFLYNSVSQQITRIDPLTSDENSGLRLVLRDINDNDRAVGWSTKTEDGVTTTVAFWMDANDPQTLNEFEVFGGVSSQPYAINDNNQVVGTARRANSAASSGFIVDLNTNEVTDIGFLSPILESSIAYDINNAGVVVGQAWADRFRGTNHAVIFENGTLADLNDRIDCDSGWELVQARSINEAGEIVGTGVFENEARAFKLIPRASGQRTACPVEEDNSGGGSLPLWYLIILLPLLRRSR